MEVRQACAVIGGVCDRCPVCRLWRMEPGYCSMG